MPATRIWTLIAALLAPLAAGCVAAPAADVAPVGGDPPVDAFAPVDMSLQGCIELGAGRFVSFEHANSLLPPGFVAQDAAVFLGMLTPTGRAVVLSGQMTCEGSTLDGEAVSWNDVIVPIERPPVPGLDLDDARSDLYQLAHWTSGAATVDALVAVGFAAELADVRVDFAISPSVPAGAASTTIEGETILSIELAGAMPTPYALFARFWHQSDAGLAYVEHERTPTTLYMGTLTSCVAAEGSIVAEAFGTTDCAGPDSIGGVFPERTDFTSTLRFLPGVRVESGA